MIGLGARETDGGWEHPREQEQRRDDMSRLDTSFVKQPSVGLNWESRLIYRQWILH